MPASAAPGSQPFRRRRIILGVFRRLALALTLSVATGAEPSGSRWPLLAGSLSGELAAFGDEGPRLAWRLDALPPEASGRRFTFMLTGAGLSARGGALYQPETGALTWRLDQAEVPLSAWLPRVASRVGLPLEGTEAAGTVHVEGEGSWADGRPVGSLRVRWEDGTVRHAADDWELSGIQIVATYDLRGTGQVACTIGGLRYGPLALQGAQIDLSLMPDSRALVTRAALQGLGGRIEAAPFDLSLANPSATVRMTLAEISLRQLVALLPPALSEAQGRLDGEVEASWSAAEGLQITGGWLGLSEGEEATLRLAPVPGLITAQLTPDNPAYSPLQRVEQGETALSVSLLRLRFTPRGDENGRTATVRLQAEPVDPLLKAPLQIDLNVAGPLDQLIKLGMDGRIRFE